MAITHEEAPGPVAKPEGQESSDQANPLRVVYRAGEPYVVAGGRQDDDTTLHGPRLGSMELRQRLYRAAQPLKVRGEPAQTRVVLYPLQPHPRGEECRGCVNLYYRLEDERALRVTATRDLERLRFANHSDVMAHHARVRERGQVRRRQHSTWSGRALVAAITGALVTAAWWAAPMVAAAVR